MKKMINILKHFGLSEYGSKAYVSLVQNPGITAYKLSEISGVPRSKIYEALNKIEEQGIVYINYQDNKKHYFALDPDQTIKLFENQQQEALSTLEQEIAKLNTDTQHDSVQIEVLTHASAIFEHIKNIIHTAENKITVSIWPDLYKIIQEEIVDHIQLQGITFKVEQPGYDLLNHRPTKYVENSKALKPFIIIIDHTYMIYGQTAEDNMRAYISRDLTQIKMMKDYIWHDVLVNKYLNQNNSEIEQEITLKRKSFFS